MREERGAQPSAVARRLVLIRGRCLRCAFTRSGRRRIIGFEPDGGGDPVGLLQHFARVVPVNGGCGVAHCGTQQAGELIDVGFETLPLRVNRWMRFE